MKFTTGIRKPQGWVEGISEGYLEVKVHEDASPAQVDAIVQALATLSSFFGARLDKGGAGGGGNGLLQSDPLFNVKIVGVGVSEGEPGSPWNIPPGPTNGPDSQIGWRQ